jgi:hypothetical protein
VICTILESHVAQVVPTIDFPQNVMSPVTLSYIPQDADPTLSFTLVTAPVQGTLTASGNALHAGDTVSGSVWNYTPVSGYTGSDSFVWRLADSAGTSAGTVSITVYPVSTPNAPPTFKPGVKLMDGAQTLQQYRNFDKATGKYDWGNPDGGTAFFTPNDYLTSKKMAMAAPELADWNNDGLTDLLVGRADGRIALYINQGTKGHPVFNGYRLLKEQNGNDIWGYWWCNCGGRGPTCAIPHVVDWNNDGKKDLMVENYGQPGFVCFNIGTDSAPLLSRRNVQSVGYPVAWNGDGIWDLVGGRCGYDWALENSPNQSITVTLGLHNNHGIMPGGYPDSSGGADMYNNAGDGSNFGTTITTGTLCPAGLRKTVAIADWTGSGKKDMIVGLQDGTLWYSPNTGSGNFPVFNSYSPLLISGTQVYVGDPAKIGHDTFGGGSGGRVESSQNFKPDNEARVAVGDLDGDGLPDLIVGDASGNITVFYQYNPKPVAMDQNVIVMPNNPKNITLTARVDSGHTPTFTKLTDPLHGQISVTGSNCVYTPNAGYTGPDSFTFNAVDGALTGRVGTVFITVKNHPPVAQSQIGNATVIATMNSARAILLSATDEGDETLTYRIVTPPANGSCVIAGNSATYTPNTGYTGPDSFTFKANDSYLDSTNVATVALDVAVLAINFQPTASPVPAGYQKDDGSLYDATRGYGWDQNLTNATMARSADPDPRLDTFVGSSAVATWSCDLPNGNYFVTFSCGDPSLNTPVSGGMHRVLVQGATAFSGTMPWSIHVLWTTTIRNQLATVANYPVTVTNGTLTVAIGGGVDGNGKPFPTALNYVEIRKAYQPFGQAAFVAEDAVTQGSWKGVYGQDGYWMLDPTWINCDGSMIPMIRRSIPSYAQLFDPAPYVTTVTKTIWRDVTTDVRALQSPFLDSRIANAVGQSATSRTMDFEVNFTDGGTHRVAVYCLDWAGNNTAAQTINILDAGDGSVLDTRTVIAFTGGKYLVWNLKGHVIIQIPPGFRLPNGNPGDISGVFFGDAPVSQPQPPVITSLLNSTPCVGTAYSYTITAANTPTGFSATGLPAWLALDRATGVISGTTPATAGTFPVTLSATNAYGTGSAVLTITVGIPMDGPVVTSAPVATGVVNVPFRYTITANNAPTSFTATSLPAWLTLNPATGVISGTPTSAAGCNVSISANNSLGSSDAVTLNITIYSAANAVPAITTQPVSTMVTAGEPAMFDVVATGASPLSYQWQRNGTAIPGATGPSYTTPPTALSDNGASYAVVVTNAYGAKTSTSVTLSVNQAMYALTLHAMGNGAGDIALNPPGGSYLPGTVVTLTASPAAGSVFTGWAGDATGMANPVTVTMTGDKNVWAGLTNTTCAITLSSGPNGYMAPSGSTVTENYGDTLTVITYANTGYFIASLLMDGVPVPLGTCQTFYYYTWSSLTTNHTLTAAFSATGATVMPAITAQPVNATVCAAETASFSVTATGVPSPTYQWMKNGANISGATAASWSFATVIGDNGAQITVLVTNAKGNVTSTAATLTVNAASHPPTVQTPLRVNPSPVTGTTAALSVLGADDGGESNLVYTWYVAALPPFAPFPVFSASGVNAAKNATVTFAMAGAYSLSAFIKDLGGNQCTSSTNITVAQTLTSFTVLPSTVTLTTGSQKTFTLYTMDQFGDAMTTTTTTWSVTGGGTITTGGVFHATTVGGPYLVSAVVGTKTGTALVSVYPVLLFQSLGRETSGHGMGFMTVYGVPYEVDWKTNLITDTWHFYTNLVGSGGAAHVTFTNAVPQGFFQILANP